MYWELIENNCLGFQKKSHQISPPTPTSGQIGDLKLNFLLCQLTCQSADIMSSLCGVGVRARVRVNNFSKTTRPRDVLFF